MDRLIIVSSSSYNLFHFQMINHVYFLFRQRRQQCMQFIVMMMMMIKVKKKIKTDFEKFTIVIMMMTRLDHRCLN